MMESIQKDQQASAIRQSIKQAKVVITLRDQLARLEKNKDFKAVFNKEYFDRYMRNQVELLANPAMQDPVARQTLHNAIEGISQLNYWMILIKQEAVRAERSIQSSQEELDYLLNEEEDEDNMEEI